MILLTGAAGYIGSHIFHEFKKKRVKILGIDNFSTNNLKNKYTKYILKLDIDNSPRLKKIIKEHKIETVIHAAAMSHPLESLRYKNKYKINNVVKTKKFIEICKSTKVKNFIFFSSSNVYTEKVNGFYNEINRTKPKNYYGKTKILIETLLTKNKNFFKNLYFLRLFNVAGYYSDFRYLENKYLYKRIFNILQNQLGKKNFFKLYYYTKKKKVLFPERDFIHIKDFNFLLLKIISKFDKNSNFKIYNVGSGKSTNIKKLIKIYEIRFKNKIKYKMMKINKIELRNVCANIKKVKSELSWKPKRNIESIVRSYI